MKLSFAKSVSIVAILLAGASACTSLPGMRAEVINGAQQEYVVRGHGKPVVVFEAGLGDGMDTWATVFDEVGSFSTAFAYNRAGYGHSTRRAEPRSGTQIVGELRAALAHAGLQPPYLLVGHSLGGTYMELFARLHPEEIAGLVLIEARAASMTRRCREAQLLACDPPKFLVAALPGAAASEYAASDATFQEVEDAGRMPAVPLVVLTSTQPRLVEGPSWSKLWLTTQKELAAQSPLGKQVTTWISGHYIHKTEPRLVIDAVSEIVNATNKLRR